MHLTTRIHLTARPQRRGRGLARLFAGLGSVIAMVAATALMPTSASAATTFCSNKTGTLSGYYYQMWTAGTGSACITLNAGNSYSTTWSGVGDFVAGVGWSAGSGHTVSFSGSMHSSGGATRVSLYGWSTNPLVEYYVMEDYNGSAPGSGTYKGQITSDGGTYKLYEHLQVNQPSIQGTATFEQYLAVRTSPVTSGTITTQNFINAWAGYGMHLGTMNYQILATEAWGGGSGGSSITVH